MDVTNHDPESQFVTVALAWAPGVMHAVPWTWESQGSTRDILFAFFFFKIKALQFTFAPRAEEAHAT